VATKTQYDCFKTVYDEETTRYAQLENRSKLYLTIITFYLGAIAFKVDAVLKFVSQFKVPISIYAAMAVVLLGALLLTVLATRIRAYEGIYDPEDVIESFGQSAPLDDEFLDDRIIDLAVAAQRNAEQNNTVARVLQWASYLLAGAVLLQLVALLFAVINSRTT